MAFCRKCGAVMEEDDAFCHMCGASVVSTLPSAGAAPAANTQNNATRQHVVNPYSGRVGTGAAKRPAVTRTRVTDSSQYQRKIEAQNEYHSMSHSSIPDVPNGGKGLAIFGMILSIIGVLISFWGLPSFIIGAVCIVLAVASSMRGYLGALRSACLILAICSFVLGGLSLIGFRACI